MCSTADPALGQDPDDIQHVEASLEAAFGLAYTVSGLTFIVFLILLDSGAAATLFCDSLDGAPVPSLSLDRMSALHKSRIMQEAAALYAAQSMQTWHRNTSASQDGDVASRQKSVGSGTPGATDRGLAPLLPGTDTTSRVRAASPASVLEPVYEMTAFFP